MTTLPPLMVVATDTAPAAIGPYSQAIVAGGLVWCSGQIALDPASGTMVGDGDVVAEAHQALRNLAAVLAAAGSGLHLVTKTTVFLRSMDDFPAVNAVYADVFGTHRPARSTVAVAGLPKGARVELEAVALIATPEVPR